MKQTKQITLHDFLTEDQIAQALEIWRHNTIPAKEICKKIIKPHIGVINIRLGQANDPMRLAYACERVFNETQKRSGG